MKTGLFTNWLITSGGIQSLQWKNVINLCKLYQKLLNMFLKLILLQDYDMLNYSNYTIICNGTTQTGIKLYFQRRYTGRSNKTDKAIN
jgi:CRISPR/Cas system-associated protein endoribonuclease Cas2